MVKHDIAVPGVGWWRVVEESLPTQPCCVLYPGTMRRSEAEGQGDRRVVTREPARSIFHFLNPGSFISKIIGFLVEPPRLIVLYAWRVVIAKNLPDRLIEMARQGIQMDSAARYPHRVNGIIATLASKPCIARK